MRVTLLLLPALLLLAVGPPSPAAPPSNGKAAPAPATRPVAPTGNRILDQLPKLKDRRLKPVEKAKLGLHLYRDEMVQPTAANPRGPGPGPAAGTHPEVLARITRELWKQGADLKLLKEEWTRVHPGEVKDCLALFVTLKGDPAAQKEVTAFLLDRQNPAPLRELAATALGELAVTKEDVSIGPVLAQAIREDAQGVFIPDPGSRAGEKPKGKLVYPIRRSAAAAIRRMQQKGLLLESFVTAAADRAQTEIPWPPAAGK